MREVAGRLSASVNRLVEIVVGLLMALLVVVVWIGVVDRYLFHWQLPWPEAVARYLMIWAALLAVSCGIARQEHIGLTMLADKLPGGMRRGVFLLLDILAMGLFAYLFWYGIAFAIGGASRQAMIFGMSLAPAFAAIPVAAALAFLQLTLVLFRDLGEHHAGSQIEDL